MRHGPRGTGSMDVERSETPKNAWACAAVTINSTHVASGTAVESSTRW